MNTQPTFLPSAEDVRKQRKWWVVDCEGQIIGRLASQVAHLLRGKHKVTWTPHMDPGDFVVVVNAKKIQATGNKLRQKIYYSHSRYFGELKEVPLRQMLERRPCTVIEKAVYRMLPTNRLRDRMMVRLKVYEGAEHPHAAQKPELFKIRWPRPSKRTA